MPDIIPKLFARSHLKWLSFQERCQQAHIFNMIAIIHVLSQEDIQEIPDSPPVLGNIWLQSFKDSTRDWLFSH